MDSKYSIIEEKLDSFIRKFYSNRIIQGLILFTVISICSLFFVFFIESFAYLQPLVKTVLFYLLCCVFALIFAIFIIVPILKIFKIIPFLNYEEASEIISKHFKTNDTLINIIQLNKQINTCTDQSLLVAAINQKADKISPLNFSLAIDFKKTFKFFLISFFIILSVFCVSLVNKNVITDGAYRFLEYKTVFKPNNPYSVSLLNNTLKSGRGEDYNLHVNISGPSAPTDVFLCFGSSKIRLNNDSTGFYSYCLRSINSDLDFYFSFLDYNSELYHLQVFDKPQVLNFSVSVIPPVYTGFSTQEFDNTGDITAPFGSVLSWNFTLSNCNYFSFLCDSSLYFDSNVTDNCVTIKKTTLKSFEYNFISYGVDSSYNISTMFHVNIIPDLFPSISVNSIQDSLSNNSLYFSGHISDDYGFHSLCFNYYFESKPQKIFSLPVDFLKSSNSQDYFYYFNFDSLSKNEKILYYFEVADNDNISGYKKSKTSITAFSFLSKDEQLQRLADLNKSFNDNISESKDLLNDLKKQLSDFQKSVSANNNLSDWEKQNKIENLSKKQEKLQNLLNQISQESQQIQNLENQLSLNQKNDLLDKQNEYNQLWEQLIDDDISKLLQQINDLKKSLNDKNLRDKINDIQFDFNQISEQIDRNNSLLKMYNVEKNINTIIDSLKQISNEYQKIADKVKKINDISTPRSNDPSNTNYKNNNETYKDVADNISELLEKLKESKSLFNNTKDLNNELGDNKLSFEDISDDFNKLLNDINTQKEELNNQSSLNQNNSDNSSYNDNSNSNSKSNELSDQINKTSEEINEMADKLSGNFHKQQESKIQENIEDIRQIQDNLISLSFDQENLIAYSKQPINNVSLVGECVKKQNTIKQDFDIIRDSIFAIAKRTPELNHSTYSVIKDIYSNFNKSISFLNSNNKSQAAIFQQRCMTSINDLSLLFNELLNNFNNQLSQSSSNSQSKTIESKNKKQSQGREQQYQNTKNNHQTLKQMLQDIFNQLSNQNNQNNKQLVESLRIQEMIIQQIQDLLNSSNNPKNRNTLNEIKQMMEQNKKDIINNNINKQTLNRQEYIFKKLLEAETAEKQQDLDELRESKSSKDIINKNNNLNRFELNKNNILFKEYLKLNYIDLNLFYINYYNSYLKNINQ